MKWPISFLGSFDPDRAKPLKDSADGYAGSRTIYIDELYELTYKIEAPDVRRAVIAAKRRYDDVAPHMPAGSAELHRVRFRDLDGQEHLLSPDELDVWLSQSAAAD